MTFQAGFKGVLLRSVVAKAKDANDPYDVGEPDLLETEAVGTAIRVLSKLIFFSCRQRVLKHYAPLCCVTSIVPYDRVELDYSASVYREIEKIVKIINEIVSFYKKS